MTPTHFSNAEPLHSWTMCQPGRIAMGRVTQDPAAVTCTDCQSVLAEDTLRQLAPCSACGGKGWDTMYTSYAPPEQVECDTCQGTGRRADL